MAGRGFDEIVKKLSAGNRAMAGSGSPKMPTVTPKIKSGKLLAMRGKIQLMQKPMQKAAEEMGEGYESKKTEAAEESMGGTHIHIHLPPMGRSKK